jgi:hypothetical protein
MKNVIKLALVLITSLSLGFSANAGTLSVSGTAKATYDILSSGGNAGNDLGKGLGITNELNFTAAGELDNGWTWNYSMELDPNAVAADNGSPQNDDTQMTLTTPYGTVGLMISEGGLNKQLGFSAAAYATGIDTGVGAIIDPVDLGSYNNIQYHSPVGLLPFGIQFKAGFSPSADTGNAASGNDQGVVATSANTFDDVIFGAADAKADFSPNAVDSVTEYSVTATPVDGLTVNASYVDVNSNIVASSTAQTYEGGAINAKYAYGPFTIGYGKTYVSPYVATGTAVNTERALYLETTDLSLGYAVNDQLSISYETSSSDAKLVAVSKLGVNTKSTNSQDSTTIQAAYTMGGMTLAVSQSQVDGDGYSKEETGANRTDVKETIFAVTMAF